MPTTRLSKTVALLYRMTDEDTEKLYNELLEARKRSWVSALQTVVQEHGCRQSANAPRLGDLEYLKSISRQDAKSITNTYNFDVEVQIERIFEQTRTANRFVFFKRLEEWNAKRNGWKLAQISLNTDVTTTAYARQQFYANNGLRGGRWIFTGPSPTCEKCVRLFAAGVVDQAFVDKHPNPQHILCPHQWTPVKSKKLDCTEVWLG